MASNATFTVEIQGNTAKFENSLKGINTAMSALKSEGKTLKNALKLDPTNNEKIVAVQKNLQKQLQLSKQKSDSLKSELKSLGSINPDNQKKFLQLQRDIANAEINAQKLEAEIKDLGAGLSKSDFKLKADIDTSGAEQKVGRLKGAFSSLKEVGIGALRQIGSSAISAIGNGLSGWVSDAMATQKAMISLKNTMDFKGNVQEFEMVKNYYSCKRGVPAPFTTIIISIFKNWFC